MTKTGLTSLLFSIGAYTLALDAANYTVTTDSSDPTVAGSLPNIINQINSATFAAPSTPQTFSVAFSPSMPTNTIALTAPLPPIVTSPTATITGTIDGSGVAGLTIDGAGANSAFIIIGNGTTSSGQVTIKNMTIQNAKASGGVGGSGFAAGGGGAGLGGALLLLNGAASNAQSVAFNNNNAQGGSGGDATSGTFTGAAGGAGIHGAGGNAGNNSEAGGGGLLGNGGTVFGGGGSAGGGLTGNGGDSNNGNGGGGGGFLFPIDAGQPDSGAGGGNGGGPNGGAGGVNSAGGAGGLASGGGGGGGGATTAVGGIGGYGGGGGAGAGNANGADGGFGGGGGGSGSPDVATGGNGGFGGGGGAGFGAGSTLPSIGGSGGFGGGGGSGACSSTGGVNSGSGGFGGGSGGAACLGGGPSTVGTPGFGAGTGGNSSTTSGGGGGASFGGVSFIQNGCSVAFVDCTFSGSSVTPSSGGPGNAPGTGGIALGTDFFLMSGGTLTFAPSTSLVLANPIESDQGAGGGSGGGVTMLGSGTLDFATTNLNNTYTGDTKIIDGSLVIASDSNLGVAANTLTFQTGSGSPVLGIVGNVTTARSTTVTGTQTATMLVNSGASLNHGGTINLNGATLNINAAASTSSTLSGVLSGTGGILSLNGPGTLTLSNSANSYTGGTIVQGGTLLVSADGALGDSSGPLTISGGTLQVGATFSSARSVFLSSTSSINTQGADLTLSGMISYNGNTTKSGSGYLVIAGPSSHTGSGVFTVDGGTLIVNGTLGSNVAVNSGSILEGTGTITGNVTVNGTTSPGNSIGTLTVNGNYTQATGSTFENEIDPASTDLLVVNGNVTIQNGTTFLLSPAAGNYNPDTAYQVIVANGGTVTGTFSNITTSSPLVTGKLFYENSAVLLFVDLLRFQDIVTTGNAHAVAVALDTIFDSGSSDLDSIFVSLVALNNQQLNSALNQLHPAQYKAMTVVQQNNVVKVRDALGYRLQNILDSNYCTSLQKNCDNQKTCIECNPGEKFVHIWADGFGDFLSQHHTLFAQSPQVGYNSRTGGAVTGIDFNFAKYLYVGALGAYTHSRVHWKQDHGKGDVNTGYAGIYASAIGKAIYANLVAIGGWNHYHAHRNIIYPGMNRTANGRHRGEQLDAHFDTGINIGKGALVLRPFDSFDFIVQKERGFKESGAGALNLSVKKKVSQMIRNELGVNLGTCLCFDKSKWIVDAKMSWVREIRLKGSKLQSEFIGTGVPFTVTGYFPDRNLWSPGLTITGKMLDDLLAVTAYYNGEYRSKYADNTVGLELGLQF